MPAYNVTVSGRYDYVINADDHDNACELACDHFDEENEGLHDIRVEYIQEVV